MISPKLYYTENANTDCAKLYKHSIIWTAFAETTLLKPLMNHSLNIAQGRTAQRFVHLQYFKSHLYVQPLLNDQYHFVWDCSHRCWCSTVSWSHSQLHHCSGCWKTQLYTNGIKWFKSPLSRIKWELLAEMELIFVVMFLLIVWIQYKSVRWCIPRFLQYTMRITK